MGFYVFLARPSPGNTIIRLNELCLCLDALVPIRWQRLCEPRPERHARVRRKIVECR
jgi:hypothetical protein